MAEVAASEGYRSPVMCVMPMEAKTVWSRLRGYERKVVGLALAEAGAGERTPSRFPA